MCSKENNEYINTENKAIEKVSEKSDFGNKINTIAQKYKSKSTDEISNKDIKRLSARANYNTISGSCETSSHLV